jgi:hypothetical protein
MLVHSLSVAAAADTSIWQRRFGFEIPATEKILRTLLVYLGLAISLPAG